jgi:hypothetical protein
MKSNDFYNSIHTDHKLIKFIRTQVNNNKQIINNKKYDNLSCSWNNESLKQS